MNIKHELIKYAKWYDRATMPEDAQTDESDLVQNVESYIQTEGKNIVFSDVSGRIELLFAFVKYLQSENAVDSAVSSYVDDFLSKQLKKNEK